MTDILTIFAAVMAIVGVAAILGVVLVRRRPKRGPGLDELFDDERPKR